MHDREFPENTDQTQHHRQQLRQHSGIGSSLHSGLKSQDKQIIQPDVAHRCHDQKDQRCQCISDGPQRIGTQIVKQRGKQPDDQHTDIGICHLILCLRYMQQIQHRMQKNHQHHHQNRRSQYPK